MTLPTPSRCMCHDSEDPFGCLRRGTTFVVVVDEFQNASVDHLFRHLNLTFQRVPDDLDLQNAVRRVAELREAALDPLEATDLAAQNDHNDQRVDVQSKEKSQ